MEKIQKLHNFSLADFRAWIFAAIFVAGNVAFPQLAHLLHVGGPVLLPIYFFTLIAAYKCGPWVGLATALVSPVVNHLLFGMPAATMLVPILVKGTLLALAAGFVARRVGRVSIVAIACIIAFYQILGTLIEWPIVGNFSVALNDFRLGTPGMLFQIFGGWAVLKSLAKF